LRFIYATFFGKKIDDWLNFETLHGKNV